MSSKLSVNALNVKIGGGAPVSIQSMKFAESLEGSIFTT